MNPLFNKIIHLNDKYNAVKEEGFPTIKGRHEALDLYQEESPKEFQRKFKNILERRGVPDWSDQEGRGILYPMISCLLAEADKEKFELMMGIGFSSSPEKLPNPKVETTKSLAHIEGLSFNPQPTYIQALKNENAWNDKRNFDWIKTYKICWVWMYSHEFKHKDNLSDWVRKHLHLDNIYLIHLYTLRNPSKKYHISLKRLKTIYLSNAHVPIWAKMIIGRI